MKLIIQLIFLGVILILYVFIDLNFKLKPRHRVFNILTSGEDKKNDIMRVKGIAVHHSATRIRNPFKHDALIDADHIDRMHRYRKFRRFKFGRVYYIGYHYVILYNGKIESGRPEDYPGAHVMGSPNYAYLGICLVGHFSKRVKSDYYYYINKPTKAQLAALSRLLMKLQVKYAIPLKEIKRHRDFDEDTTCPGDNFGWRDFMKTYKTALENGATRLKK